MKEPADATPRQQMPPKDAKAKPRKPFRTKSVSVGPSLIGNLDDISEVIAIAEGEDHK